MQFEEYSINGLQMKIPVPSSYKDCFELIRLDSFRHNGRRDSIFKVWLSSFTRTSVGFCFWFRLASYKGWLRPLAKFMMHRYKRYGLLIPARTRIGYGFNIQHSCGTVINPSAVIGNNVHIGQFTTIGAADTQAALVGDNVYIGPGVSIVGNVKIGPNAIIGAGAVVVKDVPPYTTVAGNPAKVINSFHPEMIKHPAVLPGS